MKRRFVQGDVALVFTSTSAAGPHHMRVEAPSDGAADPGQTLAPAAATIDARVQRLTSGDVMVEQGGLWRRVRVSNVGDTTWVDQRGRRLQLRRQEASRSGQGGGATDAVFAPMTGRVVVVHVAVGDTVVKGQALVVVEAMKMEQPLVAPRDGVVAKVAVSVGQLVDGGVELVALQKLAAAAPAEA